jgi:hypothetical protein
LLAVCLKSSGTALRENLEHIATVLDIQDFKASNGWIDSYKQQRIVIYKTVVGEREKYSLFTSGGMDRGTISQNYGGLQNQEHL